MNLLVFFSILYFFFAPLIGLAQSNLSGKWVGRITQTGADNVASEYYFELNLQHDEGKNTFVGTTYSHIRKDRGRYILRSELKGAWKANEKEFVFQETNLLTYENTIAKRADFCVKNAVLRFADDQKTETLVGEWFGKESKNQNPCAGGKVNLKKVLPDTTSAVQFAEEKPTTLQDRKIKKGKTIVVNHTRLKVDFFDDAEEDGDMISVNFNGKWLFRSHKLKNTARTVYINLDVQNPYNFIATFAHNLGNIPPNTTAMLIDDGKKKHKVVLKSDEKESDIVYLEYESEK
jgi:hypothetical protein